MIWMRWGDNGDAVHHKCNKCNWLCCFCFPCFPFPRSLCPLLSPQLWGIKSGRTQDTLLLNKTCCRPPFNSLKISLHTYVPLHSCCVHATQTWTICIISQHYLLVTIYYHNKDDAFVCHYQRQRRWVVAIAYSYSYRTWWHRPQRVPVP